MLLHVLYLLRRNVAEHPIFHCFASPHLYRGSRRNWDTSECYVSDRTPLSLTCQLIFCLPNAGLFIKGHLFSARTNGVHGHFIYITKGCIYFYGIEILVARKLQKKILKIPDDAAAISFLNFKSAIIELKATCSSLAIDLSLFGQ